MSQDILRRGRLKGLKPPEVDAYTSSLEADRWLFKSDIMVGKAHVIMLTEQGVVKPEDGLAILETLEELERLSYGELTKGPFEDIHVAIESIVIERLGEDVGGRMHTARSRNDEVATCLRLTVRSQVVEILKELLNLLKIFHVKSLGELNTIMPGYTHTQHAQPVTLAHHLTAYFDALVRDFERLLDAYKRVNRSPLGSCALAATGFPINRFRTAELLGFDGLIENSMDAVASRDFIVETLSDIAILATDLSRIAEELILWSSSEFKFVDLPDEYSSTSSIMPQKKNPDTMEITRAKAGRIYGNLVGALTMLKALPLTYNRDMQEVTPRLWDSIETVKYMLKILSGALEKIVFNREIMWKSAFEGFSTATELADLLVRKMGLAFRTAHMIVGALVLEALKRGLKPDEVDSRLLNEVSMKVYGKPLDLTDEDVKNALDPEKFVKARKVIGGPSPSTVEEALKRRENMLNILKSEVERLENREAEVEKRLKNAVESIRKQLRIGLKN
ncbi:argininosuccinate lyase [Candidatus Bathyarchaeota archaeon]|nr:argininosuccinate lyase [Candidatus Bathyarchaeota archaeon]MBS7617088.1 argininosuccinate lyase [Candidatus Bathyarchaeota archaeon]